MSDAQHTGFYNMLGRLTYGLLLPMMRLFIRRTERAYVLVELDGRMLFIKNWLGRQNWHLPGGGKRCGEGVAEAAARELREETGIILNAKKLNLIKQGVWRTDNLGFKYSIYATNLKIKPKLKLSKLEIIDAQWLSGEITAPAEIREAVTLFYKSAEGTRR